MPYFESTRLRRKVESATHSKFIRSPRCGDSITLFLQVVEQEIHEIGFEAMGCVISQAAASILCEHIQQRQVLDLLTMSPDDMLALLKVPLSPGRLQCGLLAYSALMQMLPSIDCAESK